jgi:hypothetical protein
LVAGSDQEEVDCVEEGVAGRRSYGSSGVAEFGFAVGDRIQKTEYRIQESPILLLVVVVLNSRSEVIHRAGDESLFPAFERERPRIVNNFAASAPSGYEFSSISEEDEFDETFEPAGCAWVGQRILR